MTNSISWADVTALGKILDWVLGSAKLRIAWEYEDGSVGERKMEVVLLRKAGTGNPMDDLVGLADTFGFLNWVSVRRLVGYVHAGGVAPIKV